MYPSLFAVLDLAVLKSWPFLSMNSPTRAVYVHLSFGRRQSGNGSRRIVRFGGPINKTLKTAVLFPTRLCRLLAAVLRKLLRHGRGQLVDGEGECPDNLHCAAQFRPLAEPAYPVADTGIYLAPAEAETTTEAGRVAEVEVLCDGPNMGSAGGPTLQSPGAVARIRYEGLLKT